VSGTGLLPVLRRWWAFTLAAAAAAALLAWAFASHQQKTYQADVDLLVGPVSADLPTVQASGALGRTYAELAHSRPVVVAAARRIGLKLTARQIDKVVTATSNDVTRIVDVQVRYSDPRAAARLAGAVAAELRQLKEKPPVESGDSVDAIMRDPGVDALPASAKRAVRAAVIGVVGSPDVGNLTVVDAPLPPRDPVSPKLPLLVVLGALTGALLACAFALLREGMANAGEQERKSTLEVGTYLHAVQDGAGKKAEEEEPAEVRDFRVWEKT
jgi:uncharacterized protein involved in exopolysaccharide biosynthesis